ncbi:MAG: hypothetical protein RLZZ210_1139 [Pseudomonadota bacterium]|jgi:3-oxoacyl-[acyl-carrier-protein] synthase-3
MKILATGIGLPADLISNEFLDEKLEMPAGYSLEKSGIKQRYFSARNELQSDLAAKAVVDAVKNANIDIKTVDLLISACGVQEQMLPCTASIIASKLDLADGIATFDVNASCLSFIIALNIASHFVESGVYKRIVIVSADQASKGINWDDPESSLIFGDGAAATIIEKGSDKQGIKSYKFSTFTKGVDFCEIRGGGTRLMKIHKGINVEADANTEINTKDYLFHMQGKKLFKLVSEKMEDFLNDLYSQGSIDKDSIDVIVLHQASHLGMSHIVKRAGFAEDKVINIYKTHGNQVGASLPSTLHEGYVSNKIKDGSRVLLLGTGAGLSIGAMILDA